MFTVKPRLGEQLVAAGVVAPEKLARALELQRQLGGYLLDILLEHHLADERPVLQHLAHAAGARYISSEELARANVQPSALKRITADHAERYQVLPLAFQVATNTLTVAVADLDERVEHVRQLAAVGTLLPILAARATIRSGIKRHYHGDTYAFATMEDRQSTAIVHLQMPGEVVAHDLLGDEPTNIVKIPWDDRQLGPDVVSWTRADDSDTPLAVQMSELEGMARELKLLRVANELHRFLARERDTKEILHRVLAFAYDNVSADDGVLLTVEPQTGVFLTQGVRTRTGDKGRVVVSETLLQEVVTTRKGVLTGDALSDKRFDDSKSVVASGIRSAMGVPLVVRGEVRGVIFLCTRERVNAFSRKELMVLMAIAGQAAIALENAELADQLVSETSMRQHLSRFFSPGLVELAASGVVNVSGVGEVQEATILFVDIRGFTAISERFGPREIVQMLNEHFAQMVDIVFAHGGILDKFIGDALMALWGVPPGRRDAPARAVTAALDMIRRVQAMNEGRVASGKMALEIGAGINTGPVVFGAIGAPRRLEFTAIGDAVNIASRLCGMAKPGQLVASESTMRATGTLFRAEELPPAKLRGKSQAIRAFRVLGERQRTEEVTRPGDQSRARTQVDTGTGRSSGRTKTGEHRAAKSSDSSHKTQADLDMPWKPER